MKKSFTILFFIMLLAYTGTRAQWVEVASGTSKNLGSIAFSGNQGVVGGSNGVLVTTTDGGLHWSDSAYYNYDPIQAVAFPSPGRVIAGTYGGYYVSIDGGVTFHSRYSFNVFDDFKDIVFTSALNGVAIDDYCSVARTYDGGENWTKQPGHPCSGVPEMDDLDFPTAAIGYLCGANGNVFKTADSGTHWTAVAAPGAPNVNYSALQFLDANTGYITGHSTNGSDTVVFKKTVDGGANWIDLRHGLIVAGYPWTHSIPSFMFADANLGYALGDNKIFKTTDGGVTWTVDYTSATIFSFNKMTITPNFVVAVGSNGGIARLGLGGGNTGVQEIKQAVQLSVYPNPSGDHVWLAGFTGQYNNLLVELFDLNGRTVRAEKIASNEMSIAGLNSGIYFGRTTDAAGNTCVFKLVKE